MSSVAPEPAAWLALSEEARLARITEEHRQTRSPMGGSPEAHAAIHAAVETRLAEGDAAATRAFERCRAAGLGRHAAVHALASVVTRHMLAALETGAPPDPTAAARDFDALDPAAFQRRPASGGGSAPPSRT